MNASQLKSTAKKSRSKPAVALVNEIEAKENIAKKLAVLERRCVEEAVLSETKHPDIWPLKDEIVELWFPKSLRQFNQWTMSSQEAADLKLASGFKGNSQDTLRKNAELRARVEAAISDLTVIFHERKSGTKKIKNKLKRELRIERDKCATVERELLKREIEIARLKKDLAVALTNIVTLKKDFEMETSKYKQFVDQLAFSEEPGGKVISFPKT